MTWKKAEYNRWLAFSKKCPMRIVEKMGIGREMRWCRLFDSRTCDISICFAWNIVKEITSKRS